MVIFEYRSGAYLKIREHRNTERRHLQTGTTTVEQALTLLLRLAVVEGALCGSSRSLSSRLCLLIRLAHRLSGGNRICAGPFDGGGFFFRGHHA